MIPNMIMKRKRVGWIIVLGVVVWAVWLSSASANAQQKETVPRNAPAIADPAAFRGEARFQQGCGFCHLGRFRKSGQLPSIASNLSGILKDPSPDREAAVREQIQRGSLNMPGFGNALSPKALDELIAYLKTL